jgi:hypothetical protein
MIKNIYFHTNLDEPQLPASLGDCICRNINSSIFHIPQIGSQIEIPYYNRLIALEVCSITYVASKILGEYSIRIELHIPKSFSRMSIKDWEDRMRAIRGGV